MWHPCTQMQRARTAVPPLPVARAKGPWLEDYEGRRYFDANSSWWVNLFGHADARINAALHDQLDRLPHVMLAGCTHGPAVELAERLSALTGGVLGHVFYASDGASAVEIALKMSFHYWRNTGQDAKREFVCVRHGYHGETLGALAVTDVAVFRDAYDPLLMRAHMVMSPDARQAGEGESAADVAARAIAEVRTLFSQRQGHLAAIIVEPLVQCAAGMAMHDPAYLRGLRALCDEFGVHLIADEIAVGCGRTGSFFAFEQAAPPGEPPLWPDFVCLSKGISGGYLPLSLVMTRDAVYSAFLGDDVARGFLHSHSYTGNALACRAALAVLDRFAEDDVLERNRADARALTTALAPLHGDARVEHMRQRGMIWAFDVREPFAGERFAERFHLAGREHGLLIRPIGRTVYLLPPYVLDEGLAQWLAQRTLATLDATLRRTPDIHAACTPEPPVA
ncbi:adenosylmethionine--8-amino-7-oxononanoate transaminase [Thauera sinica]|uniref:Adenosylmethionine-8-amino-7-oxononanoate aminotransferase n=1 Tax=Thauera sinica TaxID=2665146 RepID=A0ABW1ANS4_9RHOO